jgi:hypothetical protein
MLECMSGVLSKELAYNNASLFLGNPEWTWDSLYGWRRDINSDDTTFYTESSFIPVPVNRIRKLKQIEASFSSFYNTPENCLGTNILKIIFQDGSYKYIGTGDSHSDGAKGQFIYNDDLPDESLTQTSITNRLIRYTIPVDKVPISIGVISNGFFAIYPFTLRGFKDLKLTFK